MRCKMDKVEKIKEFVQCLKNGCSHRVRGMDVVIVAHEDLDEILAEMLEEKDD